MHRISQLISFLLILSLLTSCGFVRQTGELKRFVNCSFTLYSIEVSEINGINLSGIQRASDLGWLNMLSIGQQIISGSLPAKLKIDLFVQNNSPKIAAVAGLDYKLFLKEEIITEGSVMEAMQVLPISSARFPVTVDIDLMKLMKSSSVDQLLELAFGDNQEEVLEQIGAKIQIKPYYLSGSVIKKYPGYINIRL